jgi:hypothetical protein
MYKIYKILILVIEELRNQVINLFFILIIDFIVLLIDKYYYTFLADYTLLQKHYISLTISFIIFLSLLPILLPWQTSLMMKYNKRNMNLKPRDNSKDKPEN